MDGQQFVKCAQYLLDCSNPKLADSLVTTLVKVIGWNGDAGAVSYIEQEMTKVVEVTDSTALIQVGFTYPITSTQSEFFHGLLRNLLVDMREAVVFFKPNTLQSD